jgi:hypothetical protein
VSLLERLRGATAVVSGGRLVTLYRQHKKYRRPRRRYFNDFDVDN